MPVTVGLTGGIGMGKSTVAAIFKRLGAEIVVGDELGRRAIEESARLRDLIRDRFGDSVFAGDKIDRGKLAAAVFTDPEQVQWLTRATFPFIHQEWQKAVAATSARVIVFDAALIFEWQIEKEFDNVLVVTANDSVVNERAGSGRFTSGELARRRGMQLPIEHKLAGADYVIENNGDISELERHVQLIWQEIESK